MGRRTTGAGKESVTVRVHRHDHATAKRLLPSAKSDLEIFRLLLNRAKEGGDAEFRLIEARVEQQRIMEAHEVTARRLAKVLIELRSAIKRGQALQVQLNAVKGKMSPGQFARHLSQIDVPALIRDTEDSRGEL